jgi:hypothetical protein
MVNIQYLADSEVHSCCPLDKFLMRDLKAAKIADDEEWRLLGCYAVWLL